MESSCGRRHVLVTGASTGIGRATALRLAGDGFHVFATVRRIADGKALVLAAGRGCLDALTMDVLDRDLIQDAARTVRRHTGGRGLDALVNNAGVGMFQPLELVDLETFRRQLDVNVTGQLAVSQAFLPMLRVASGRIVMIGSIGDRITVPFAGPTAAAKRALLSLTEALRLELAPWGIKVILIEPASIHTEAVGKLEKESTKALDDFGPEGHALYGETFRHVIERGLAQERKGSPPDVVAAAVARAIRAPRPRARYLVGKDSRRLALIAKLPPVALDLLRRRLFGLPEPGSMTAQNGVLPSDGTRSYGVRPR
ncbi:SDR family NAD(P)-dependent oxidoreductase [Kribbella sp. NPDC050241]|uniref:SDR family NAD(P)-dependent oxidoreductase n=1 Tax=Kribbella sp. NPDC050241 TaxID=3364115 RepID=UPI0037A6F351